MTLLAFGAPAYEDLAAELLRDPRETCAVGFTRGTAQGSRLECRLVVAAAEIAPEDAYVDRTPISASLSPGYLMDVANRARAGGFGIVLIHSHPGDPDVPRFSRVDDDGETSLAGYFRGRVKGVPHLAMVVSPGGARARFLGTADAVGLVEVGASLRDLSASDATTPDSRFDRQVRAFGVAGQAVLSRLHVGVVGVGGTGSVTAQQLAHLGVRHFTLVDPDVVEVTNLNRLVGSVPSDVGRSKIEVARRQVQAIAPIAEVNGIQGDVVDETIARALLACDVIFLCTDSHASRAVVGQIAYQYFIPTIDMGVSISVRGGNVAFVTGRVQLLTPGLPCLACIDALDAEQVRREFLTPEQRAQDPYISGAHEPQRKSVV